MTTDASGKQPPRAATRSTRASHERKELLEAAQSAVAGENNGPEPATKGTTTTGKETADGGGGSSATEEPSGSAGDQASTAATTRRSGRRAGAKSTDEKTVEAEPGATTTTAETESAATKAVDAAAVAACVAGGASLSTAATRFGISRAEVTKIVKETTIQSTATDTVLEATEEPESTPTTTPTTTKDGVASDASTETASDSDGVAGKRGASKRGTAREDEGTLTSENTVMATAPAVVAPSVPVAAAPAVTIPSGTTNELKRSADALTDATAPLASSGNGSVMPKAKRVRKTREEKLSILAFVDDGGTHVAAAEKFGVSRTAVTKMVKERDIIMSGLSGKQHAAASAALNGAQQQSMVAALVGTSHQQMATPLENAPTPPARKTRAASNTSTPRSQQQQQTTGGDPPHPKAKRVRKTNEEKLLILEFVERGGSQGAAAEKFGVSRTAVTKMVKEREAITAQVLSGKSNHRKVLQYQHKLSIIEDMLYKWQVQVENDAPNLKITGDLLQSKAVEFRDKILAEWKDSLEPEVVQSLSDFKASNGWLHRYLQRRNLRTASKREYHRRASPNGTSNGNASNTVPSSPSDPFNMNLLLADLSQRLRTVPVQCIWNMDEIALLPKACTAPPTPSSATKEDDSAVAERDAADMPLDRMTVVLMVNAAGEKFKPEVLIAEGSVEKQLDELQKAHPTLLVTSQPNAWQDTTALALYLHAVSIEAKRRQETWYIVMDASVCHMEFAQLVDPAGSFEQGYRFESLVLLFLPLQATTEQQPLHHGIARVFKAAYRHAMFAALVQKWSATEGAKTSFDASTQIGVSEQIAWLASAWEAVPSALIRHCWVRNGLLSPAQLAQISQDNSRAVEAELFRTLTDTIALLLEQDGGALAQHLGMEVNKLSSGEGAESSSVPLLDRVNALITLDDNEPTERKLEMPSANNHVITETDANGDLRALV